MSASAGTPATATPVRLPEMSVSPPEVGMPRSCSSALVNPGATSPGTAPSPCPLPAAALPPVAPATAAPQRRQCLGGRCLPILRWLRSQKPNKPQPQKQQPQEEPYQQQSLPNGAQLPEAVQLQLQQKLQLQQRLQLQQKRLQQLLQKQEQESQQQKYKRQQQLHQQDECQESQLMLQLGQLDTTGLSTPYTGWSSSSSKGLSSKNSGVSVGLNISTLGTPGHSSGGSNSVSRTGSVSSSEGSSSGSSGRSQSLVLLSPRCKTSGHNYLKSAKSSDPSILGSSSRSRRSSNCTIINSSREGAYVAAAQVRARHVSAASPCGAASAAAVAKTSLTAPLSAAIRADAALCAAGVGAGPADQYAGGDATSLAARAAVELPPFGLLTGRPTRPQSAATATAPKKPAEGGKPGTTGTPGTPAGPVSRTGAAADATDEWEGPDLLDTPVHRKDRSRQLDIQEQKQPGPPGQQRPASQEQQQPVLQGQPQTEHMPSTGGCCFPPLRSGIPGASAVPSLASQSTATAHAAARAPHLAVASTSVAVPSADPSRLASRIVEPSAASRPATPITDMQSNQQQQQQRRQLDDSQLLTLPLLGGEFGAAQVTCGSSLPRTPAGESEKDADQCSKCPNKCSSVGRGAQSETEAPGLIIDASSAVAAAVRASGPVVTRAAFAKEDNIQTSQEENQQQLSRHQQLEKQTLDAKRADRQENVHLPAQQQGQRVHSQRLEPSSTPHFKGKPHSSQLEPSNSEDRHAGPCGGSPPVVAGAAAAIELAATVVEAAASTAADTIAPSAEALVSSVTQTFSSLLATGPPGCSLLAFRRQQQPKQQQHQQEAILYHEEQRMRQYSVPMLPSPSTSSLQQNQQRRTQEQQLLQQMLQELHLGQREVQQPLLESSVSPLPPSEIQDSHTLQQLRACDLLRQQEQKQHKLQPQRLQAPTLQGAQTGTYATTRSESPVRLKLRCSLPSKPHQQRQQHLLLLQEQQQRRAPPAKQRIEMQRTFFGVHLSAEAEAAAATAAGAAAAAATAAAARPTELPTGPPGPPSAAGACLPWPQEGTPSGRRSPAGQQAAEASRRAMLLRKNSQSSLLHVCTAASQDQQLQQPHLEQQQTSCETRSSHAVPLAAAAAAATGAPATGAAAALARTKLEDCETSPTDFSSNSTNVTSDVSSANSMRSALTPQLLYPSRRTPFPLQQPGAEIEPAPEVATTLTERPPTPIRAERLRKRLERLRDIGQLSRDTYPAAEVASLISGTRVEKEGPFPVYVLDKDWSLGCSALDPDWPQKMLQNTKEGIKLHSEINRLLALAKEVDLAQTKGEPR